MPITIYQLYKYRNLIQYHEILNLKTLLYLVATGSVWCVGSTLFVVSTDYTLVSHSIIMMNLSGVCMVALGLIMGTQVHRLEIIGTAIVLIFALVLVSDGESSKVGPNTNILFGDCIALTVSPIYAAFYMMNTKNVKKMPAMIVLHILSCVQVLCYILLMLYKTDLDFALIFSADPHQGMFGWTSPEFLPLSLFLVAPIGGVLGTGSYVFLLDYFTPLAVANLFLMEPVFAQGLGIMLGQDNFPGMMTYLGATGIVVGLAFSIKGEGLKLAKKRAHSVVDASNKIIDIEMSSFDSLLD